MLMILHLLEYTTVMILTFSSQLVTRTAILLGKSQETGSEFAHITIFMIISVDFILLEHLAQTLHLSELVIYPMMRAFLMWKRGVGKSLFSQHP